MSGPHSLKHIASNSIEILSSLPRSGGRLAQKTQAQLVAGAYFKSLKALAELEETLNEAGVLAAPAGNRAHALVLAPTVPMTTQQVAPAPPEPPPPRPLPQVAAWLQRLQWIVCIYLPAAVLGTAALIALLSAVHVASNPEIIFDATVDAAVS